LSNGEAGIVTSTLAFVEFADQATPALRLLGGAEERIIALTPHAEYALDRLGVPYRRPEDYYDEERLEGLGIGNFQVVERLCTFLDEYWQRAMPYFADHSLRPAWSCVYELKMLYDAITIRLFQLQGILDCERPARVVFYRTAEEAFGEDLRWQKHESIYSHVLQLLCRVRGIEAVGIEWHPPSEPTSPGRKPAAAKEWVKRGLKNLLERGGVWPTIELYRKVGLRMALPGLLSRLFRLGHPKGAVLFNSLDYGVPWVLASLLDRKDLDLWLWREGEAPQRFGRLPSLKISLAPEGISPLTDRMLDEAWLALRTESEFRRFFISQGLDWFGLVESRLHFFSTTVLQRLAYFHQQASSWLRQMRLAAVVSCPTVGPWRRTLIRAAKENGIPVIVLPQGEVGSHFVPINYYIDPIVADWYLAYGPGVVEYLYSHYPSLQKTMKAIPTGAPMIDGLRRAPGRSELCRRFGLDPTRRIVIYVLTTILGNQRYISYHGWSDSEYFRITKHIMSLFTAYHDIQLVLKVHPNEAHPRSPLVEYVQDQGLRNCKIVGAYPFDQMVNLADMFIMDVSTTALLQMMTTDTPIYIFNNLFRWEPEALEALRKRVYLFDDLDAFCQQLDMDLRSGRCFERLLVDRTFLQLYGVPEEGTAAERCAQAIREIALGQQDLAGSLDWFKRAAC
jgi:hypothetical protein